MSALTRSPWPWIRPIASLAVSVALGACQSPGPGVMAVPIATVGVPPKHEKKIPGRYVVYLDLAGFAKRSVKSDFACSSHTYTVDIGPAFAAALIKSLEDVFEEVEVATDEAPAADALRARNLAGIVRVRAESLRVQLWSPITRRSVTVFRHTSHFLSGGGFRASADLATSIAVERGRDRILAVEARGSGSTRVESSLRHTFATNSVLPGTCDIFAEAAAGAVQQALSNLVGAVVERLVTSPGLRGG